MKYNRIAYQENIDNGPETEMFRQEEIFDYQLLKRQTIENRGKEVG